MVGGCWWILPHFAILKFPLWFPDQEFLLRLFGITSARSQCQNLQRNSSRLARLWDVAGYGMLLNSYIVSFKKRGKHMDKRVIKLSPSHVISRRLGKRSHSPPHLQWAPQCLQCQNRKCCQEARNSNLTPKQLHSRAHSCVWYSHDSCWAVATTKTHTYDSWCNVYQSVHTRGALLWLTPAVTASSTWASRKPVQ